MSYPHSPDPWQHGGGQQPPQRDDYGQMPGAPQHPGAAAPQGPAGYGYPAQGVPQQQPQQSGGWGQPQWEQPQQAGMPPSAPGWGQPQPPHAAQAPWGQSPYHVPRRPGTVLGGAIMTYIGSGFMIVVGLLLLVGSLSASFLAGAAEGAAADGLPSSSIRVLILGLGAYCLVLGIVLILLSVYAQKGRNGARITLTVIGGLQIAIGILSVLFGSPQTIVSIVYVAVAVLLFWVGGASDWYRTQRAAH